MQQKQKKQIKRKPRSAENKLAQLSSSSAPSLRREIAFGFPSRKRLTLKYSDTFEMSSTSGAVITQQFRANSLFDPDYTGIGHQPRGFDQWCSATGPYQVYRVLEHRVAVKASTSYNAQLEGQIVCGYSDLSTLPSLPSSAATNVSAQSELRGWKAAILPIGAPVQRLDFDAKIADIEGVSESAVLSEDGYSAQYGANPTDIAWFSIQACCLTGGTGTVYVQVDMEFDVQFEQPILLAAS